MSQRSRIAMTGDEVAFWTYRTSRKAYGLARDRRGPCLTEAGTDGFEPRGPVLHGPVRLLTDPNDVRYVGSQVVRRTMDPDDDTAIDSIAGETAAKRYAHVVEPSGVASGNHRELT